MELDKELAETVDHACEVGGNGYYMRFLLVAMRDENKALRAIVSGADISRSTLVSEVSGLTDDVERLEQSLNRATQSMADKDKLMADKDKQIAKLKKKKGR